MKKISILLFLSIVLLTSPAFAQTPEITNGLSYLMSTQNPDGSWGGTDTSINTDFYSTVVSAETLKILNETNTQAYTNSIQWLTDYTAADNGGYIAWRILALSDENIDLSADLSLLLQWQNKDGGWGGQLDYLSSNFHTALSLQTLKAVNHPDLDTISSALFYLTNNQNTDGGFGFYPEDNTNVYMTALVLKVFSSYSSMFSVLASASRLGRQSSIDSAVTYLISKKTPDGGFGTSTPSTGVPTGQAGSGSTVYETASAFKAWLQVVFMRQQA